MKSVFQELWETKNKDDEWWSSFVTAPLAVCFNVIVVKWKVITPNRITFLSFLFSLIGSTFILWGTFPAFVFAAILINLGLVFDCMDGQMAKYKGATSPFGSYYDKVTDQLKIFLMFAAVAYSAYQQSQNVTVIFLAFTGVSFYYIRVYVKYLTIYIEMEMNPKYLEDFSAKAKRRSQEQSAGPGKGVLKNLKWFLQEQRKFFLFNEAVLVFLVSFGLVFNKIEMVLWIFAISQVFYGIRRSWQRGAQIYHAQHEELLKPLEK